MQIFIIPSLNRTFKSNIVQSDLSTKGGKIVEKHILTAILERVYDLSDYQLHSLNSQQLADGTCVYEMYRIQRPAPFPSLVFLACHDRLVEMSTFRWEREDSVHDWFEQRVRLLGYLEQQD